MKKAMLIFDNPKACWDCLCFSENSEECLMWCGKTREDLTYKHVGKRKPDWCPLIEIEIE